MRPVDIGRHLAAANHLVHAQLDRVPPRHRVAMSRLLRGPRSAAQARYKTGKLPATATATAAASKRNSAASSTASTAITAAVAAARQGAARPAGLRGSQRGKQSITAEIHHRHPSRRVLHWSSRRARNIPGASEVCSGQPVAHSSNFTASLGRAAAPGPLRRRCAICARTRSSRVTGKTITVSADRRFGAHLASVMTRVSLESSFRMRDNVSCRIACALSRSPMLTG